MLNRFNYYSTKSSLDIGFTVVELLIVIALIAIIGAMIIPYGMNFYGEVLFEEEASTFSQNLKTAQSRATAGKENSSWGVRLNPDDQGCDSCYVLFKGDSYSERDENFDEVFNLSPDTTVEGMEEVVFKKGAGTAEIK